VARAINDLARADGFSALGQARAALAGPGLDNDERLAMELLLDYLQFGLDMHTGDQKSLATHFRGLLARFAAPCPSPIAEAQRRRLLFQTQVIGEIEGLGQFDAASVLSLFEGIPAELRTPEVWHYAALWACRHRELGLLDLAYEAMVERRRVVDFSFLWHRVRLLHRLGHGTATRDDAEALLAECTRPGLLRDFERRILPLLKRAGLDGGKVGPGLELRKAG
jgi:hypothetical protein